MPPIERIAISLEGDLLKKFEELSGTKGYTNRSEAVRDLIREALVQEEWKAGAADITAIVTVVYNHEGMELAQRLADVQHDNFKLIVSTMHVHMDEHLCLEVIVLRGGASKVKKLGESLISIRGVVYGRMIPMTRGVGL
ncbi:MAG TPA: nickel-responsive transcriptional regulator NikR [Candidatus Brocadiia bacterium]|nr:nickel-responsive transcriptional regulator NikR [Candidatus Brocadiia bacterium]